MSKERARRRAARLEEQARARRAADRAALRRARVRELRRRLPRRGRTGRLRSRRDRARWTGVVIVAVFVQLLAWYLDASGGVRLAIALLTLLVIPVAATLTLDRSDRR